MLLMKLKPLQFKLGSLPILTCFISQWIIISLFAGICREMEKQLHIRSITKCILKTKAGLQVNLVIFSLAKIGSIVIKMLIFNKNLGRKDNKLKEWFTNGFLSQLEKDTPRFFEEISYSCMILMMNLRRSH